MQKLGDATRPFFETFWGIIAPYQDELWNYCRKLAGNPWDGEDLFQDTILKMFTSLSTGLTFAAQDGLLLEKPLQYRFPKCPCTTALISIDEIQNFANIVDVEGFGEMHLTIRKT
jgi:hypothetical protein